MATRGGPAARRADPVIRPLTNKFKELRAASLKKRKTTTPHEYEDHDDRAPLVAGDETRIEMHQIARAPEWEQDKADFQRNIADINTKMGALKQLHQKHVAQVGFDENPEDEMRIELATKEITDIFVKSQGIIAKIQRKAKATEKVSTEQEKHMFKNIQQAMAVELQDLSSSFRKVQANYLTRMKSREDRAHTHDLFGESEDQPDDSAGNLVDLETGFNEAQAQELAQNTLQIQQREQDILNIVKSIEQLNTIFRELAILIVDQGTILDRIDYNLETAVHHIEEGNKELDGAEKYQKSAGKKLIIIFLVIVVIAMIIGLIVYSKAKK